MFVSLVTQSKDSKASILQHIARALLVHKPFVELLGVVWRITFTISGASENDEFLGLKLVLLIVFSIYSLHFKAELLGFVRKSVGEIFGSSCLRVKDDLQAQGIVVLRGHLNFRRVCALLSRGRRSLC
jgi:hypothetical protein